MKDKIVGELQINVMTLKKIKAWIKRKTLWLGKRFVEHWPSISTLSIGMIQGLPKIYKSITFFGKIATTSSLKFRNYDPDILTILFLSCFLAFIILSSRQKDKKSDEDKENNRQLQEKLDAANRELVITNGKFANTEAQLSNVMNELRLNKIELEKLRRAHELAPDHKVFKTARLSFKLTYNFLKTLKSYEPEFENGKFENYMVLEDCLKEINKIVLDLAKDFFVFQSDTISANFMFYFENDNDNQPTISKLMSTFPSLYIRNDKSEFLEGVLFLPPKFVDGILNKENEDAKGYAIVLPIYKGEAKAYNHPDTPYKDNIYIPGATLAFSEGTSFVADTQVQASYNRINKETIQEAIGYFTSKGKNVKSFLSFRIPTKEARGKAEGVLNIDSSKDLAFSRPEEEFSTLHTMIYPILKLTSKYLCYYRNYIKVELTKEVT